MKRQTTKCKNIFTMGISDKQLILKYTNDSHNSTITTK